MNPLRHAFKEWAVIVRALADGRQALILRKGGVAERDGVFRVEHTRFWLYPTYVHAQPTGILPEAADLFAHAEAERPAGPFVRLTHFAEVEGVYHVHDLASALKLVPLHVWSRETVQARFLYRSPGLFVLPVRVYRAAEPTELPETPAYAGCKTWVDLGRNLPTDGATPVLDDAASSEVQRQLEDILKPTALA